jgi:hypothetical protein
MKLSVLSVAEVEKSLRRLRIAALFSSWHGSDVPVNPALAGIIAAA